MLHTLRTQAYHGIAVFVAVGSMIPYRASAAFGLSNPLKTQTLEELLYLILNSLIFILFPILVLAMVYTGWLFVAAQGNPTKIADARRALIWTIVGATILLGAKAIAIMIKATLVPFF